MRRILFRATALVTLLITVMLTAEAQDPDTTKPTSVDPRLIEWENSTTPREYVIGDVTVSGVRYLDSAIVLSISGGARNFLVMYRYTPPASRATGSILK